MPDSNGAIAESRTANLVEALTNALYGRSALIDGDPALSSIELTISFDSTSVRRIRYRSESFEELRGRRS